MVVRCDAESSGGKEEIPHDHLFKVTGLSSSNLEKLAQASEPEPADFETAISATGYGWFNVVLMLVSLPAFWSAVSVTSAVSYIFSRAQCDMHLTLLHMGTLSAVTYAGMISSAMLWGFLSDTLGRRQVMMWGFLGAGIFEITSAFSQSFAMLVCTKFASGFLFNGPFAVLISYIAELHRTELRARVILLSSLFYTFANTTLPLLAWAFLTHNWDFHLFGNRLVIHSWNLFLLATAIVPFVTGIAFCFMPESPKFLMSRGRNEEALKIFKTMYYMNNGHLKGDYPITRLEAEKSVEQARGTAALRGGVKQLTPLFQAPHGPWLLLMCLIHLGVMFGSNTIRLWYPQLAAMLGAAPNSSLCEALTPERVPSPEPANCAPIDTNMLTYLQSAVVGLGSILTYGIGGMLVNVCGKKLLSGVCSVASGITIVLLPLLDAGEFAVVAMVTTALAFTSLCASTLSSITVDLFPTTLRVMALATFLMSGRVGTIIGTVIFPALIEFGCYPPFIAIAAVLAVCGVACFLVPNTHLKRLE